MSNLIGQSLGRYHILEQLGEGGMATVYKAFDTRLETDVAVKIIRTDKFTPEVLARAIKRFEREAKALARLTHPNIVKVTDYGEYNSQPYLIMPFLSGGNLKQHLREHGFLPWQDAVRLLLPIARALEYAHSQGVIHRDVKPANILLTQSNQPMLTDFGVAKVIDDEATMDLTGTSATVGTPEYMAPEQVTSRTVDSRVDIYALGIVLYEMMTGRKPFTADTPMAVLFKHVSEPLPRPRQFAPNMPDSVEKILIKALAKKPEHRYQSMDEFAGALEKEITRDQEKSGRKKGKSDKPEREVLGLEKKVEKSKPALPQSSFGKHRFSIKRLLPIIVIVLILGIFLPVCIRLFNLGMQGQGLLAVLATRTTMPTFTFISTSTNTRTITLTPSITATLMSTSNPKISNNTPLPNKTEISNLSIEILDSHDVSMELVPEGKFIMGSNNGESDEKPINTVLLDSFYIDKYEVTNGLYKNCVSAGVCKQPLGVVSRTHTDYYINSKFEDYPVIYVDWKMAKTYCEWRGVRLPTEAEWEKAARGTDARKYPWGEEFNCSRGNSKGCIGDVTAVGSYQSGSSIYGVYDLSGNVWEWVSTLYRPYPYDKNDGRDNLDSSGQIGLRGGSWLGAAFDNRSSNRYGTLPYVYDDIGFRCASDVNP